MHSLLILSGVSSTLKEELRKLKDIKIIEPYHKLFPDGEQYLRIDITNIDEVTVLQSLYPEQDKKVVELYLALEALKGLGIKVPRVILTYVAYARQDKRFLRGEPISVRAVYEPLIKLFEVFELVTIDVHSEKPFIDMGFKLINVKPHKYMIEKANIRVDMVLAPDKGALARAQEVAQKLGIPFDHLDKFRDRITGEITISSKALDVKDKSVVIVDDIISTGGTLAKAAEALYRAGAKEVYAAVTHALLSQKAIERLYSAGLKCLVITDSVVQGIDLPPWIKVVSLAELIYEIVTSGR